MFRLIPRDEGFFDLFEKLSGRVHEGAVQLSALIERFDDVEARTAKIKDVEHEGDVITHEAMDRLNRTFITPFDREDIHELASRLDDILDLIDTTANRIFLYKVARPGEDAVRLARCVVDATKLLTEMVAYLRTPAKVDEVLRIGRGIHAKENEADRVQQHALATLFDNATDPRDIIKWKDIYYDLETASDRCEDAANVIEGIILKNA